MTDDQLREAVAETQGFININTVCWRGHLNGIETSIPDYPKDMNAMRAVEITMDSKHYDEYADVLWRLVDYGEIAYPNKLIVAMADARQRAEAYFTVVPPSSRVDYPALVHKFWPNVTVGRYILHKTSSISETGIHAKWTDKTGLAINFKDIDRAEVFESSTGKCLNLTLRQGPREG